METIMTNITLADLLKAGVHFGHKTCHWHPKMEQYIFRTHGNIHIIDLQKTLPLFQEALNFLSSVASKHGKILFVGTKLNAKDLVKEMAIKCGMPYVNDRWLGGMLTNYKTIRHSIKRLKELDTLFEKNVFGQRTKKEILTLSRERQKLERSFGGVKDMGGLPDALFIIDVHHEKIAIQEAQKMHIPTVGIVDTNTDPSEIDYVVPGNDDSAHAVSLYLHTVCDSILNSSGHENAMSGQMGDDEFVEFVEEPVEQAAE